MALQKNNGYHIDLLKRVLDVCRCKSSVKIDEWYQLRTEIQAITNGVSFEKPPLDHESRLLVIEIDKKKKELHSVNEKLRYRSKLVEKTDKYKKQVRAYQKREQQLMAVLKSRIELEKETNDE